MSIRTTEIISNVMFNRLFLASSAKLTTRLTKGSTILNMIDCATGMVLTRLNDSDKLIYLRLYQQ